VPALLNRLDQYHRRATSLTVAVSSAREVWVTEAVLLEIGNALARSNRTGAVRFIESCYGTANVRVEALTAELFRRGLELYRDRADKEWGLTDCISFVVMQDNRLTHALTADEHFRQPGFRALLLEDAPA
jgi:predicted nucleic acid-binding protein